MKSRHFLLAAYFLSGIGYTLWAQTGTLPTARVTIVVKDSDGAPLENVRVGMGGTLEAKPGEAMKGLTTHDGRFSAEVRSNGEIGITARKDGYYDTFGPDYNFRNVKG